MRLSSAQFQTLNALNQLTAHLVSPLINCTFLEDSLKLTAELFRREPTAADILKKAYDALIFGDSRLDDCELLEYFVYTTGVGRECATVGAGGLYRLVDATASTLGILETLRVHPPPGVSFLAGKSSKLSDFLWGGYLAVEPRSARSPHAMPFIIQHILLTARNIIRSNGLVPVILAFTLRHDNFRVQRFYEHLGFEKIGASLEYAGAIQDVFALNLTPESPGLSRLSAMVELSISHQASFNRES